MIAKGGYVYILTNKHHTVLYIGVTANLYTRIYQHKNRTFRNSFTSRYNLDKLVYHEHFSNIEAAIAREKQLKEWSRERKLQLIEKQNPVWKDLWEEVQDWF